MFSTILSGRQKKIRPPGPPLFTLIDIIKGDDVFVNLEFPLKLMQTYGSLCSLPIARNIYMVSGAKEMEEILKTKAHNFSKDNFLYKRMRVLFGKSLLVTDGSYWKQRRKITQPAFQMNSIKQYIPTMTAACHSLIEKLLRKPPRKLDMVSLMNLTSLKLTCKLFCGEDVPDNILHKLGKGIYFSNWYLTHNMCIRPWKPTLNNLRFYYQRYRLDSILLSMIRRRRQTIEGDEDLLQLLMNAKNEESNLPLSDLEILNEFKTLILTGHETTAVGLSWMWYLLSKYPYYRTLLEQELTEVLGDKPQLWKTSRN